MTGNLFEWVGDWYGNYSSVPQTDSLGPLSGSFRVMRSGYWGVWYLPSLRCADRNWYEPYRSTLEYGFRVCRRIQE